MKARYFFSNLECSFHVGELKCKEVIISLHIQKLSQIQNSQYVIHKSLKDQDLKWQLRYLLQLHFHSGTEES
jgi:hypothetical protein